MLKEDIKFMPSTVFEGMTSIRAVISAYDQGISDRKIEKIYFDKAKLKKIAKEIGYFKAVSEKYGFELIESDQQFLEEITLGSSHGGIVAITTDRTIPRLSSDFITAGSGFYCMIDGIEDPYNFGYALRSLYACGVEGVILPERNWLSAAGIVCRSSAGASELIRFASATCEGAVEIFKQHSYKIVCADMDTDNILGNTSLPFPLLLIVGGEKRGISRKILDLADIKIKIPYAREFKASLSAASATTMFAYEIMRQNLK